MHSSHTLYPKMELLLLLHRSIVDSFFFFFYITKYFSLSRARHGSCEWISDSHALCTIVRESVLFVSLSFFLSLFRLDPLFIDWSSSRKKKKICCTQKRAPLIRYFIIYIISYCTALESRTLNVTASAFFFLFTYNYIDIHYITLFLYTLKTWQQIASLSATEFLSKSDAKNGKR